MTSGLPLEMSNVSLRHNTVTAVPGGIGGGGGAACVGAPLTVLASTFLQNIAQVRSGKAQDVSHPLGSVDL